MTTWTDYVPRAAPRLPRFEDALRFKDRAANDWTFTRPRHDYTADRIACSGWDAAFISFVCLDCGREWTFDTPDRETRREALVRHYCDFSKLGATD